jgi:hypothetical protein
MRVLLGALLVVVGINIIASFTSDPIVHFGKAASGGHNPQIRTELRPVMNLKNIVVFDKAICNGDASPPSQALVQGWNEKPIWSEGRHIISANGIAHSMGDAIRQYNLAAWAHCLGRTVDIQRFRRLDHFCYLASSHVNCRRFTRIVEVHDDENWAPVHYATQDYSKRHSSKP